MAWTALPLMSSCFVFTQASQQPCAVGIREPTCEMGKWKLGFTPQPRVLIPRSVLFPSWPTCASQSLLSLSHRLNSILGLLLLPQGLCTSWFPWWKPFPLHLDFLITEVSAHWSPPSSKECPICPATLHYITWLHCPHSPYQYLKLSCLFVCFIWLLSLTLGISMGPIFLHFQCLTQKWLINTTEQMNGTNKVPLSTIPFPLKIYYRYGLKLGVQPRLVVQNSDLNYL